MPPTTQLRLAPSNDHHLSSNHFWVPSLVLLSWDGGNLLPSGVQASSSFQYLHRPGNITRWQRPAAPPPQPHPPLVYLNLIPLLIRSQWKTLGGVCSLWNCIFVLQIESVPAVQLHTVLNMFVWMCNEIGGLYDKTNITIVAIPKKYQSFLALNDPCICTASRVRESVIPSVLSTDLFWHIPQFFD